KLGDGHSRPGHAGTQSAGSQPSDHLLPVWPRGPRRGGRQMGVRQGGRRRPGPAPVGLLLRDCAMSTERLANRQESTRTDIRDNRESTLTADQCTDAMTPAERTLAEVLADVLRINHLSVESHFFDELGADSLVMAKFCARVRKRGAFPPVSMKDIYEHPTIRSLAAALADAAPAPGKSAAAAALEVPTSTSTRDYLLCGALQTLFYLGYSYAGVLAAVEGY